jgi:hypothetical protein
MRSAVISGMVVLAAALAPAGIASAAAAWPSAAPGTAAAPLHADQLTSVWCVSSSKCVAVGTRTIQEPVNGPNPLVAMWNGSKWTDSMLTDPAGVSEGFLDAVTCGSPVSCFAVGAAFLPKPGKFGMFVESWNGKSWKPTVLPLAAGHHDKDLVAVSCAKPTACLAVGSLDGASGHDGMIAEWWNGKAWKLVPVPGRTGFSAGDLTGVSCVAVTRCVAVGNYAGKAGDIAVAKTWNGKSWSDATLPAQPHRYPVMSSVSCVSAASCVAVGSSFEGTGPFVSKVVADSWNGKTWRLTAAVTPEPGSTLSEVTCVSARNCMAVGSWTRGFDLLGDELTGGPIAESWNGKPWVSAKVPGPIGTTDGNGSALDSVSCPAATRCLAVGQAEFGQSLPVNLAELWTGKAWKIIPAP